MLCSIGVLVSLFAGSRPNCALPVVAPAPGAAAAAGGQWGTPRAEQSEEATASTGTAAISRELIRFNLPVGVAAMNCRVLGPLVGPLTQERMDLIPCATMAEPPMSFNPCVFKQLSDCFNMGGRVTASPRAPGARPLGLLVGTPLFDLCFATQNLISRMWPHMGPGFRGEALLVAAALCRFGLPEPDVTYVVVRAEHGSHAVCPTVVEPVDAVASAAAAVLVTSGQATSSGRGIKRRGVVRKRATEGTRVVAPRPKSNRSTRTTKRVLASAVSVQGCHIPEMDDNYDDEDYEPN